MGNEATNFAIFAGMKLLLLGIVMLVASSAASAQDSLLVSWNQQYHSINRSAMTILGGWAALNLTTGILGLLSTRGEVRSFHMMNASWGVVNGTIAAVSLLSSPSVDLPRYSIVVADYNALQSFLALNVGLDVAYIATGFVLRERARSSQHADVLRGFGSSLLLQGAGLLLFDGILWLILHNHGSTLVPILDRVQFTGTGLRVAL